MSPIGSEHSADAGGQSGAVATQIHAARGRLVSEVHMEKGPIAELKPVAGLTPLRFAVFIYAPVLGVRSGKKASPAFLSYKLLAHQRADEASCRSTIDDHFAKGFVARARALI